MVVSPGYTSVVSYPKYLYPDIGPVQMPNVIQTEIILILVIDTNNKGKPIHKIYSFV